MHSLVLAANNTGILAPVVLEAAVGPPAAAVGMLATIALYFQQIPLAMVCFEADRGADPPPGEAPGRSGHGGGAATAGGGTRREAGGEEAGAAGAGLPAALGLAHALRLIASNSLMWTTGAATVGSPAAPASRNPARTASSRAARLTRSSPTPRIAWDSRSPPLRLRGSAHPARAPSP